MKKSKVSDLVLEIGSKYMATTNLGQPCKHGSADDVRQDWARCVRLHDCEGVEVDDERQSWEKDIRKGNEFTMKTLRDELPWLFEVSEKA